MKSTVAAIIGGIVGALIWGAISYFTGYEVGYVAWGIGALIGFLSATFGGSGMSNGVVCAVVAFFSLVGGKFVAVQMSIDKELQPVLEPQYAMLKEESEKFVTLESEQAVAQFMVDHDYTQVMEANRVSKAELADFQSTTAPLLQRVHDGMTYEELQGEIVADMGGVIGLIKEGIGGIDVIFFLLGIYTAFKIGLGNEESSTDPQMLG